MGAWRAALIGLALLAPATAWAQAEPFSPQSLSGYLDLRAAAADGDSSWLDGGLGKTRFGPGATLSVGEAALAWRPTLAWDWSAVVEGEIQPDHESSPRLGEAYLRFKPFPVDGLRYGARAGLFYPPVSEEHGGVFWTPTQTITPSAINSWIGEEVKVAGLELYASQALGDQTLGLTAGVFGADETAGALLSLRGWSLDDVEAGADSNFRLPPLGAFLQRRQSAFTTPVRELDGRAGYYGRLDWTVSPRLSLNAFLYDLPGDPTARDRLQWSWDTRFADLGARADLDADWSLLSQLMVGEAKMGPQADDPWVQDDFAAAYVMAVRRFGDDAVSGRFDLFQTRDWADLIYGRTSEHGWALTADLRHPLTAHATGLLELLHVESDRPGPTPAQALSPYERQTLAQAGLRLSF